jgi:hypothetical protein
MNKKPEYIYLDLNVVNTDKKNPLQLNFTENRSSDILMGNGLENYKISVVRFYLETNSLPLMIPDLISNTETDYIITLKHLNHSFSQRILFKPQDLSLSPPVFNRNTYFSNPYYFYYSFQHFVDTINEAFKLAYIGLEALVGVNDMPVGSFNPPVVFELDSSSGFCNMYTCPSTNSELDDEDRIDIFFNATLYESIFANAFKSIYNPINNNEEFKLVVINNFSLNTYTFVISNNNIEYITNISEYPITPLWNCVKEIVLTSSIPITPNAISATRNVDGSFNSASNSLSSSILTTLEVLPTIGTEYKSVIEYLPTAQYRYMHINGSGSLNNININCLWRNKFNQFNPLLLNPLSCASIKVLFQLKN